MDGKKNHKQAGAVRLVPRLALLLAVAITNAGIASEVDHREFDATLHAPYQADANGRQFTLEFDYPFVAQAQNVGWRLELVNASGQVVAQWSGVERLFKKPVSVKVRMDDESAFAAGTYTVRMTAASVDASSAVDKSEEGLSALFASAGDELAEQSWDIAIGPVTAQQMPRFAPMATARSSNGGSAKQSGRASGSGGTSKESRSAVATAALPYTVYFGNLHSQTNHSDGGGALTSCTGAQNPQSAAYGPTDAYTYAANKGLDFLMASEHNHMYDGSDSTNTAAVPSVAKSLFQSGLTAASNFNAAHPNFLGVYGLEWGVINNGGHMNIINTTELLEWESNASGQLIGDTFTAKGDYAGLYTLMAQKGWVGQFNHPASSGQFLVNSVPLGYTPDGDTAMALCEVLNTSAFSTNTTETETGRSSYEGACKKALEAGYHIAFSSNQDNHCANWGASYTNRTGVLIPTGTPLTTASFVDAVKARRVFATMDKNSQLVLTANGHVMGERFTNSGPLNLVANFASSAGRSAATVSIVEGVPGRNGTATELSTLANVTTTPSVGEHYYYAKITQDDGNILWSAPVWVTQLDSGGADVTPPTVSASESGSSGTITLSATASDAVGVTAVDFYVDGALTGSDGSAPYAITVDSTTLTNASHSLVAKARDAAGNVGNSTAVSFTVNNPIVDTTAPTVSSSESGTSGTITLSATASDNVGVSRVEFYVDGVLKSTDTTAPYAATLDSTTLSNGSHALTAKAFDAAGNSATSSTVNFSVSNVAPDTTAPSVSASESGTSGTITMSATASDNVGVTKVEFYIDGALKSTDTTSPYSATLNSTTLTNGSHALTAKAYDAAGNVATSTAANFSINNAATQLIVNGGFESGSTSWTASSGVITNDSTQAGHGGSYKAWLDGYGAAHTDTMYQTVTIPSTATSATLSFWLRVESDETTTTQAYDTLKVQVRSSANAVLSTLATYSNLNKGTTFTQKTFDLSAYKGQTVRIYFEGVEGSTVTTSFIVDDVSLTTQ